MRKLPNALLAAAVVLVTLQLMMHSICVLAVDLDQCGARLQGQQNTTQNTTDAQGSPPTLRVSYEQCLVECGGGLGDINWQYFSSNFGAWSLPWISLMFQIPFGGERKSARPSFMLNRLSHNEQSHWTILCPFSSPSVPPPSLHTPSRLHTSTGVGSLERSWMSNTPILNSSQLSWLLFTTFPLRWNTIHLSSTP